MMLSKAGKTMATQTITTMSNTLATIFRIPRVAKERPVRLGVSDMDVSFKPQKCSIVETMGRALSGSFVSGIMAMKTHNAIDRN